MQRIYRMTLGSVLCAVVSTSALAQTGAKPMVLKEPYPAIRVEGPSYAVAPQDSPVYQQSPQSPPDSLRPVYNSKVHALALRGVPLAASDSASIKKLIATQLKELITAVRPLRSDTTAVGRAKMENFQIEFYRRRVPELRAVLSAAQQAVFDQNLKALEESNYSFVNEAGQSVSRMTWDPRALTR
jgi:hypothetical protein